jgi:AraC family L-rhamnose operon regulatory protein RhaS
MRLVFVESGSGLLEVGERQLVVMAPALLCLNETELPRLTRKTNLSAQALYFHPSIINGSFDFENIRRDDTPAEWNVSDFQDYQWLAPFVRRGATDSILLALGPNTVTQVARLFGAVAQGLTQRVDNYWPCRSRSYFLELLFIIDRLRREAEPARSELPLGARAVDVGELILYLHSHYGEKISLDQLGREFHSNRTSVSAQFRQATGQTVMAYLAHLRLQVASLMLRDTTLPIGEIAYRTGFADATHFGRSFRRSIGYLPSEYRQRNCWMVN